MAAASEGLPVPSYGGAALADLTPSLLAALGVHDAPNPLGLEPLRRACVLLVDGLGWELLRQAPAEAPFLHGLSERGRPLSAGFPSTTAAGVAAIGTGCPPGEHGIVGYQLGVPGYDRPLNVLSWALAGPRPVVDLRPSLPPEQFQPRPTVSERAAAAGVAATVVAPSVQARSGLTRAVLRGAAFVAAVGHGDLVAQVAGALERTERALVYVYIGDLDAVGHAWDTCGGRCRRPGGSSSPSWID
jgi:hypothetical protein